MASPCAERYEALDSLRRSYLDRARECSALTHPYLIPPEGTTSDTRLPTPHQGVGSRGVNNLAARLLLALLPPDMPFFRLVPTDAQAKRLLESKKDPQNPRAATEIDKDLHAIEDTVMSEVERSGMRSAIHEALKHLIVAGNALLYLPSSGGVRVYSLDKYVVMRDDSGNLLEAVIKEAVSPAVLDEEILSLITVQNPKENVTVYTKFYRDGGRWHTYQEIEGVIVPGSEGSWPLNTPPLIALRWNQVDAEDYGRGFCEQHLGDLDSLERLSANILAASAMASKVVYVVNPNGITDVDSLAKAETGDFVAGNAQDVAVIQQDKAVDLSIAAQTASQIEQRLGQSFMLFDAINLEGRDRVTRREVELQQQNMEQNLGGVFTLLARELQDPLARGLIARLEKQQQIENTNGLVTPTVVTGTAAFGRQYDLRNMETLMQLIGALGADKIDTYVNISEFIDRATTALGIKSDSLIKTADQLQQEQAAAQQQIQQQQLASIAQSAAPQAVKQLAPQEAQ